MAQARMETAEKGCKHINYGATEFIASQLGNHLHGDLPLLR